MWIRPNGQVDPRHMLNPTPTPRSYMVETSFDVLRCNQVHVTPRPAESNQTTTNSDNSESQAVTHSRIGTGLTPTLALLLLIFILLLFSPLRNQVTLGV